MRILITGGAGFIGSHVAEALADRGYEVAIIDNLSTGKKENLPRNARFYRADFANAYSMDRIFKEVRPDAVFHFAARISVRDSLIHPIAYTKADVIGSMRLIEIAKRYQVKKFIFSSTGGVMYGEVERFPISEDVVPQPGSPYAMSKLFIEQYLFSSSMPAVALRFANVYGPRQNSQSEAGVIAIFSEKMLKGDQPILNNDGKTTRDYIFVSDVVAANIAALENARILGAFNIGTGRETDVNEVFSLMNRQFDLTFSPVYAKAPIPETRRSALSSKKFQDLSGWQSAVSLEDGIVQVVEWFRQKQHIVPQRKYFGISRFADWPSFFI